MATQFLYYPRKCCASTFLCENPMRSPVTYDPKVMSCELENNFDEICEFALQNLCMCLSGCYTEYNICKTALFYTVSGVNKDERSLHPLRRSTSQIMEGAGRIKGEKGRRSKNGYFSPAVPVWAMFFAGRRMSPAICMMPVVGLIVVAKLP